MPFDVFYFRIHNLHYCHTRMLEIYVDHIMSQNESNWLFVFDKLVVTNINLFYNDDK